MGGFRSGMRPGRLAFGDEGLDALLSILQGQVLHHDPGGRSVGSADVLLHLFVKSGFAQSYDRPAALAYPAGDSQGLVFQLVFWDHPADEPMQKRLLSSHGFSRQQHLHRNLERIVEKQIN